MALIVWHHDTTRTIEELDAAVVAPFPPSSLALCCFQMCIHRWGYGGHVSRWTKGFCHTAVCERGFYFFRDGWVCFPAGGSDAVSQGRIFTWLYAPDIIGLCWCWAGAGAAGADVFLFVEDRL